MNHQQAFDKGREYQNNVNGNIIIALRKGLEAREKEVGGLQWKLENLTKLNDKDQRNLRRYRKKLRQAGIKP
jgi:hypothetical protein